MGLFDGGLFRNQASTGTYNNPSSGYVAGGQTPDLSSGAYGDPINAFGGNTPQMSLAQVLRGIMNGDKAALDTQEGRMILQGMQQSLGYKMSMDQLNRQKSLAGAQAGIGKQGNDIDIAALLRKFNLGTDMGAMDRDSLARQVQDFVFNAGQARQGWEQTGAQLDFGIGQDRQSWDQILQELQYGKDRTAQDLNTGAQDQEYNLRSAATASGAVTASGTRRGYNSIYDQLNKRLQDNQKGFDWGKADLDRQRAAGEKGYEWGKSDLDRSIKKGEFDYKQGEAGFADASRRMDLNDTERKAQYEDDKRRLDLASKSLGLSAADTSSRIQNQINQLGLQSFLEPSQLLEGFEDLRNNRVSPLSQVAKMMVDMGLDPNQLVGSQ